MEIGQPVLDRVALPIKKQVCSMEVLLDPDVLSDKEVTTAARSTFYQLQLIN